MTVFWSLSCVEKLIIVRLVIFRYLKTYFHFLCNIRHIYFESKRPLKLSLYATSRVGASRPVSLPYREPASSSHFGPVDSHCPAKGAPESSAVRKLLTTTRHVQTLPLSNHLLQL